MVAVGDVERVHGIEFLADGGDGRRLGNGPGSVAYAVGDDIGYWLAIRRCSDQCINDGGLRVGQQHRAGLCVERFDLANAIVFLVRAREFVLADAVGVVIGDRGGSNEPGLHMLPHDHPVGVEAWRRVAHQHASRDHVVQVCRGTGIDLGRVRVNVCRQVDLGLRNVQKTPRLVGGSLTCFGAGEHIIGWGGNVAGTFGQWAQAGKGFDQ